MLLVVVVYALDQRVSVAVDAAGELSQENLRVAPVSHVQTGTWCENTNFDSMHKKGCGVCASSCNAHQLTTSSSTDATSHAITFTTQMECYNACMDATATTQNKTCSAISFDIDAGQCTLHYTMPVGAVCGGTTSGACGANPHNTGDAIAQEKIESCQNQACFINEAMFKEAAEIHRLGHGSCHRGEVVSGQPGGMVITQDLIVMGMPYTDGLTPASTACSATVTTDCWPPAAQLAWCEAKCDADTTCRSFNLGKRFKRCTGACDYSSAPGEYYCTLFGTTPSRASTDTNDHREQGCHAYSDSAASSFSTQIDVHTLSDCQAPYGPDCYVKSTRTDKDFISRGSGFCQMDNKAQATVLAKLDAGTGNTFTMAQCQAECEARQTGDTPCVGGSHGITSDSSRSTQSFCVLYQACTGSTCSTTEIGQDITTSSTELVAQSLCADQCGGAYNDDGTIHTAPTPCACLNQGPNLEGWQGDAGDANWRDSATDKFACCTGECKACMDSYSSECFAVAKV